MKKSAGILPYRIQDSGKIEVFLTHPGGPFWKHKTGEKCWTISKGEFTTETPFDAALREFEEETSFKLDPTQVYLNLGNHRQSSGKDVYCFATYQDLDSSKVVSNLFTVESPPGYFTNYPEVDKTQWFSIEDAFKMVFIGQRPFIQKLENYLKGKPLTITENTK
jgi:predicted NUDIX family NTP pyrophosphohydrolase